MSRKAPSTDLSSAKTFNVAVVGLSGTEREKGVAGVGKSCLINRFVRPNADDYFTDHISILSQSDFAGRVVNNDHFLYWGDAVRTSDDGSDIKFHIIEQTEFADDSSFQSFRIGKTEPYFKRCAALRLQSAEKLAYICKNQLGLEHEFEQKLLPDGRISIDGFLCLFDVSEVGHRPVSRQVEHVQCILLQIAKTKKPVVLVTTKNDEVQRSHVTEAEHLIGRKELRGAGPITIVETSAHDNVNVELAFMMLAHLIERGGTSAGKNRLRIIPYAEAAKARREVIEVATEAYLGLIRTQVTDYNCQWETGRRRLQTDSDFIHYTELCGSSQAEKLFRRHIVGLRDKFVQHRQSQHLRRLEMILRDILPDLSTIADRSWYSTLLWLKRQPFFDMFFVVVPEDSSWKETIHLENRDDRIPFDLLEILEAENIFRNHVNILRMEQKKIELKREFKRLLEDNRQVGPGKTLSEVAIFFLGRECFTNLSEKEKQEIYDEHQNTLRAVARREFLELLLENAECLSCFEHVQVTSEDIREINERLQNESRFRALARMEEDRRGILLNHLGFIQRSYRDCCPFRDKCADVLVEQVQAAQAQRPQVWNRNSQLLLDTQDNRLQFVILGSDDLADQLAEEIRMQCVEDEYMLDGELFSLEYRTLNSDINLLSHLSINEQFQPQGCFCVYHSQSTFEYVRLSLEKTLLSDLLRDDRLPFQGLPIVLVLGHNPDVSEKGLSVLREEGQALADRLQCPFVDIPSSMMVNVNRRFHEDQIGLAMHQLIIAIKRRSSACVRPWLATAECMEPDIRVLMCIMCGDGFDFELPLSPLLNHQFSFVSLSQEGIVSISLETYFDESKHKVEVTVSSYHGASQLKDCLYHGFLLVYWAKRKASLATLKAFANKALTAPTLVLAVTETGANVFFTSEQMKMLLTEGNAFADSRRASFMTTCANFQQQTASYSVFFKECWELKSDTELSYTSAVSGLATGASIRPSALLCLPNPAVHERMKTRPPAELPKHLTLSTMAKSSTSNSADESDTANVDLNAESSDQRPSSASSQPLSRLRPTTSISGSLIMADSNGLGDYDDVYSEITSQDTDFLIKPPVNSRHQQAAKSRRDIYATDRYRKSFPGASNSFTSSGYFCDVSTTEDTDGSGGGFSSPKQQRVRNTGYISTAVRYSSFSPSSAMCLGEPRYQFRKSNSMKLALKEDEEGYPGQSGEKALRQDKKSPPPTKPKSQHSAKYKAYDTGKLADGCQVSPSVTSSSLRKAAPLATPDPVDVFGDYAQVKDALDPYPLVQIENNYASVADVLPAGRLHRIRSAVSRKQDGSETDSEYSSAELDRQKDPWVNRRQVVFKKKQNHKPRGSNVSPGDDHQVLLHCDQLDKVCDYSPSDGTDGTADEVDNSLVITSSASNKGKKKKSIRISRKKLSDVEQQSTFTDSDAVNARKTSIDEEGKELVTWRQRLRLRSEKDSGDGDRQSRKDERKPRNAQEDERRSKSKSKIDKSRSPGRKSKKDSKFSLYGRGKEGATLEELSRSSSSLVPEFVNACVSYVEAEGLATEGLYRVPGSRAHVDLLMDSFRDDPNFDMVQANVSINAVGTALKQFFSELREPVIPQSFYSSLQDAVNMTDRTMRLLTIRGILQKLEQANFAVLKCIITHLNRVSKSSSLNSMDCKNLSICWWPTLMWPQILSMDTMYLTTRPLEELVFLLIEQCGFFFYGESEVT